MGWLAARSLFGAPRWLLLIGALVALAGSVTALVMGFNHLVSSARESGLKQGRSEIQSKWNAEKAGREQARAELSEAMSEAITGFGDNMRRSVDVIYGKSRDINVRLKQEISNDPRYHSVECSLTPGVRDQINAARSLSKPAAPTGVHDGGVPTSGAAVRLDFGSPGD